MEQQPVIPACASLEHRVVLALSAVIMCLSARANSSLLLAAHLVQPVLLQLVFVYCSIVADAI